MGFELDRFRIGSASIDPVVLCPICKKVLDDPVQLDCVRLTEDQNTDKPKASSSQRKVDHHIFCRTCIVEYFADSGIVCPVDGEKFKRNTKRSLISSPPKKIYDILSKLEIACDFNGCSTVVQLKDLDDHIDSCEFKAAPILKISLSGGTYNSIASYHHPSYTTTYEVVGRTNGGSSHEVEDNLNEFSNGDDPSKLDDGIDERLRKLERRYQERLDSTKHHLESRFNRLTHDQVEKIKISSRKEIETIMKSHQLQVSQVEEKLRKEVEGLKRHWIDDTQKPLKKQKLRRIEPSPSGKDDDDQLSARITSRLDEMFRIQKKELVHMITVEMVKTEKVLRQELKDLSDGIKKELIKEFKNGKHLKNLKSEPKGSLQSSRAIRASSRENADQIGNQMADDLRRTQQELRVLRSEVRKILRISEPKPSKKRVTPATDLKQDEECATTASDTLLVGQTSQSKPVSKTPVNKLKGKGRKKHGNSKFYKLRRPPIANSQGCSQSANTGIQELNPSEITANEAIPRIAVAEGAPCQENTCVPEEAVIAKKRRGRPPGKKSQGAISQKSISGKLPSKSKAIPLMKEKKTYKVKGPKIAAEQLPARTPKKKYSKRVKMVLDKCRRSTRHSTQVVPLEKRQTRSKEGSEPIKEKRKYVRKTVPGCADKSTPAAKEGKRRGRPPGKSTMKAAIPAVAPPVVEDETTLTEPLTLPLQSSDEQPAQNEPVMTATIEKPEEKVEIAQASEEKQITNEPEKVENVAPITPKEPEPEISKPKSSESDILSTPKVVQEENTQKEAEKSSEVKISEIPKSTNDTPRRGGDDILAAAMDAIGGGADTFGDSPSPSMIPLPPVATIAGKQFFASFPLSIPFSLPVSIPVFGRLSNSCTSSTFTKATVSTPSKPLALPQATLHITQTNTTVTTSTVTASQRPDVIKPVPQKQINDTIPAPEKSIPLTNVTETVDASDGSAIDINGENSNSESTLPFRKRRAATAAPIQDPEATQSTVAPGAATFDENAPGDFNIINHILQIEENLKPGAKNCELESQTRKIEPVVADDDDEDTDELAKFASITEQVLKDLSSNDNSNEEAVHELEPLNPAHLPDKDLPSHESDRGKAEFSASFLASSSRTPTSEPNVISGPNATLVSPTSFQPYTRNESTPQIHNLTQVPPEKLYNSNNPENYDFNGEKERNQSATVPPTSNSWY